MTESRNWYSLARVTHRQPYYGIRAHVAARGTTSHKYIPSIPHGGKNFPYHSHASHPPPVCTFTEALPTLPFIHSYTRSFIQRPASFAPPLPHPTLSSSCSLSFPSAPRIFIAPLFRDAPPDARGPETVIRRGL